MAPATGTEPAGRDRRHRRDGHAARARPLRHGQVERHEGHRVLPRLRPAAVVGPPGRDRVRGQGHPRRRLREDHRDDQPRGGRPRRRAPHLPASSRSTTGSLVAWPARSCTSSWPSCWPGRRVVVVGAPDGDRAWRSPGFVAARRARSTRPQTAGLRAGDVIVSVERAPVTAPDQLDRRSSGALGRQARHRGASSADGRRHDAGGRRSTAATCRPSAGRRPRRHRTHRLGVIGISRRRVTVRGPAPRPWAPSGVDVGQVVTAATVDRARPRLLAPRDLVERPPADQRQGRRSRRPRTRAAGPAQSIVGAVRAAIAGRSRQGVIDADRGPGRRSSSSSACSTCCPMLPLDGGHVAIAVYERIRSRRGRPYYRADVDQAAARWPTPSWPLVLGCSSSLTAAVPRRHATRSAEPRSSDRHRRGAGTAEWAHGPVRRAADPAPRDPPDPRRRRGRRWRRARSRSSR